MHSTQKKMWVPGLHSDSSSSSEDSDSSEDMRPSMKKRPRVQESAMEVNVPSRPEVPVGTTATSRPRRVNNIWGAVMQEAILDQTIEKINMGNIVRDRDVESYFVLDDEGSNHSQSQEKTSVSTRGSHLNGRHPPHKATTTSRGNWRRNKRTYHYNSPGKYKTSRRPSVTLGSTLPTSTSQEEEGGTTREGTGTTEDDTHSSDGCYSTDIHLDPNDVAQLLDDTVSNHEEDELEASDKEMAADESAPVSSTSVAPGQPVGDTSTPHGSPHSSGTSAATSKPVPATAAQKRSRKRSRGQRSGKTSTGGSIHNRLGPRVGPHIPDLFMKGNLSRDAPAHIVAITLASLLREKKVELMERCVQTLGVEVCNKFYVDTITMERSGGLLTVDGSRRRTTGGVFLHLVKSSPDLTTEQSSIIFKPDIQERKIVKAARNKFQKHTPLTKVKPTGESTGLFSVSVIPPPDSEEAQLVARGLQSYDDVMDAETEENCAVSVTVSSSPPIESVDTASLTPHNSPRPPSSVLTSPSLVEAVVSAQEPLDMDIKEDGELSD